MRVLFVDDEPNVLAALERSFFDLDGDWEIETADSGPRALARLDEQPIDVVVTDMRMPGFSGVELLEAVQERHPEIIRIVLSGHARQQDTVRVLPLAHRYLSKPCPVEELVGTLEDTASLHRLLRDRGLMEFVGRIRSLPSVPTLYRDLCAALDRSNTQADDVVRIIERDPALCARVLQMASSSFFRRSAPPTNIRDAVVRVGTDVLRMVVLAAGVFEGANTNDSIEGAVVQLQQEALGAAELARSIAPTPRLAKQAWVAALLHDVGLLVMLVQTRQPLGATKGRTIAAERAAWGTTHADVGAYLLGLWGLPRVVVDAVAYHHEPARAGNEETGLVEIIHTAICISTGHEPDLDHLERVGAHGLIERWEARQPTGEHS